MTHIAVDAQAASPQYRMAYIWTISLVAALGGLLFGYDWVVIGGAAEFYQKEFGLTSKLDIGWAQSCALVGCLIGAIVAGGLSDRYGRKRLLILAGMLFVATGIGVALAPTFPMFVVFRILGGAGIGIASNISPMYIAEVSPGSVRGKFVSLNQLTIVIGILAAQFANYVIGKYGDSCDRASIAAASPRSSTLVDPAVAKAFIGKYAPAISPENVNEFIAAQGTGLSSQAVVDMLANHKVSVPPTYMELARRGLVPWNELVGWRWMFGAVTLPGVLFFFAMFFVPESPRWLVKNGKHDRARKILGSIGGPIYGDQETAQIQQTLMHETERVDFRELLEPQMKKVLVLGVVLAVLQQWCGINVIFNYANEIFGKAGYNINDTLGIIVTTGVVNLIVTFVAIYTVDRLGRRTLMLAGEAGLAVIFSVLGLCYFLQHSGMAISPATMLGLVLAAIACYGCTLAPVTWVVLSEIFPNRIRGAAMSVSVFALWVGCFALTCSFPALNRSLESYGTFWCYAGICVIGFVFIFSCLPETKGKSLEQIEQELVD